MNVLIVGGGGREHALAKAISTSIKCTRLYAVPGNPGISKFATCIELSSENNEAIIQECKRFNIELVVIGPEVPLVAGLADALRASNILAFGPSAAAAELEGSKYFARDFCKRYDIPQPNFSRFTDNQKAKKYVDEMGSECVVKADGLAAGKGVVVCKTKKQAFDTIDMMLSGGFGAASDTIIVEECISGAELSAFALIDSEEVIWLASARDHKRAFNGDEGPNTGGMGAVSPSPDETNKLREHIIEKILNPVAKGMVLDGKPYTGILYAGLMLTDTGPKVIEFNCRFGDPEAQVILPRLESDLLDLILLHCNQAQKDAVIKFSNDVAITVVMANKGYPGSYEPNSIIKDIDLVSLNTDCFIYHSGTAMNQKGEIIAKGGRVLSITAKAKSYQKARLEAYETVSKINWENGFYRTDIADF